MVLGGDWNCTVDFTVDRTAEEPHLRSATCLSGLLTEFELSGVWRVRNAKVRQYTWLIRNVLDICKLSDVNVGLLSLDQEKAFDRVDHQYLFK